MKKNIEPLQYKCFTVRHYNDCIFTIEKICFISLFHVCIWTEETTVKCRNITVPNKKMLQHHWCSPVYTYYKLSITVVKLMIWTCFTDTKLEKRKAFSQPSFQGASKPALFILFQSNLLVCPASPVCLGVYECTIQNQEVDCNAGLIG